MKYMLMIIGRNEWEEAYSEADFAAEMEAHAAFAEYLQARGIAFSGEALHEPSASSTVRHSAEGITVTDGPFVDVKEGIGGFYLIETNSLEEAVEAARHCPAEIAVEVRPVYDTGD